MILNTLEVDREKKNVYNDTRKVIFMEFIKKEENDYFVIEAIENDAVIGFINYKFKQNRKVWLNNIKVNKEYRHTGIGTTLLYLFENDCLDHFIKEVEGKFYPHDEEGSVVKTFYEKHGYYVKGFDY